MGRRYHLLDGVRGVAAGAVLLLHAYLNRAPVQLASAVDLFYLLSGFVIADAYEARIRLQGPWPFVRARLARLYPMYLAGLAIFPIYFVGYRLAAGAWMVSPAELVETLALNCLYLPTHFVIPQAWGDQMLFALDGPAWSLMFEMIANLLFAFLLPWLTNRALIIIVAVSALGLVLLQLHGGFNVGFSWRHAGGAIPRLGYSFPLGVLLWRARLPKIDVSPWFVLALTLALLLSPPLLMILLGGPLILLLARRTDSFRGAALMAFLGAISYPLYAIHLPLLNVLAWTFSIEGIHARWVTPICGVVVIIAAYGAMKLWDEPARRWLAQNRQARTPALAST